MSAKSCVGTARPGCPLTYKVCKALKAPPVLLARQVQQVLLEPLVLLALLVIPAQLARKAQWVIKAPPDRWDRKAYKVFLVSLVPPARKAQWVIKVPSARWARWDPKARKVQQV